MEKINGATKYGIFWIPEGDIVECITQWKKLVREVEPSASYLEHPVHSTFFILMGNKEDEPMIIRALKELSKKQRSFSVEFDKWLVFKNDLATGGDTLTISIAPSNTIYALQENIAISLQPYKKQNVPYTVNWQGPYLEAYNNWGFPFCGGHWLPHISVASVKYDGRKIIDEALLQNTLPQAAVISNISLYKIEGDGHTLITTIQLK